MFTSPGRRGESTPTSPTGTTIPPLPPLLCGLLWGKVSPYAGAPAVIVGGLTFFLWSDKVLGEPFGIPANFIGIGMNCLVLFLVHQAMRGRKAEGPFIPDVN